MTNQPIKPEHRELAENIILTADAADNFELEVELVAQLIANAFPPTIDQEIKIFAMDCMAGFTVCHVLADKRKPSQLVNTIKEHLKKCKDFLSRRTDKTLEPLMVDKEHGVKSSSDAGSIPAGSTSSLSNEKVCPLCKGEVLNDPVNWCGKCKGTGKISTKEENDSQVGLGIVKKGGDAKMNTLQVAGPLINPALNSTPNAGSTPASTASEKSLGQITYEAHNEKPLGWPCKGIAFDRVGRFTQQCWERVAKTVATEAIRRHDSEKDEFLNWLWANCKITYYGDGLIYPTEHNVAVHKDARIFIQGAYARIKKGS
jgi:hypothetical protein